MQLIAPVRPDHSQPLRPDVSREKTDDISRRSIGPVEVLQDAHDRCPLPEVAQEGEEAFEDPRLDPFGARKVAGVGRGRPPELRHETTKLHGRRGAECLDVETAEPATREQRRQAP